MTGLHDALLYELMWAIRVAVAAGLVAAIGAVLVTTRWRGW